MKLDESQNAAVKAAMQNRFCIINGGAGVGKTTIIKRVAEKLEARGENVELCAFAGKAAARIREATNHESQTIHRLLGYRGDYGFTTKTLSSASVIVDEASMIPSSLLYEIVKRNPARLVLVGDEAQLPPVGSGQPFHDTIRFCPDKVYTLTKSYRNSEAVYAAAMQIRVGQIPQMESRSANEYFKFTNCNTPEKVHKHILDCVRNGEVDFDQDIILCCRNGTGENAPASVKTMNKDIKDIVNPGERRIGEGDRIINSKNCPELDVWNGTTGSAQRFDVSGAMYVFLDYPAIDYSRMAIGGEYAHTSSVMINKMNVQDWDLAYALTTHKSQGSQYRKVFFVCLNRDLYSGLLTRSMLYTAVTRAKAECHVIGEYSAFQKAIQSTPDKKTILQYLFKKAATNA